jgi:hypothetical protein
MCHLIAEDFSKCSTPIIQGTLISLHSQLSMQSSLNLEDHETKPNPKKHLHGPPLIRCVCRWSILKICLHDVGNKSKLTNR